MKAIVFDTETTGTADDAEIIEAAWVDALEPGTLSGGALLELGVGCFLQRYKPIYPISLGAMSTHNIMDEDLVDCPPSSTFALPEGVEYLIGHNVDFDWRMAGSPDIKRICTLALCRHFFPNLDCHTQSAMMYHLFREIARDRLKSAHSAAHDVINCNLILQYLLSNVIEAETWEEVWLISETARIPTVMTFGKYKGWQVENVPIDYRMWYKRQPDTDPYLLKAFGFDVEGV